MQKSYFLFILILSVIIASCSKDEANTDYTTAEDFKVYIDKEDNIDIMVVDAFRSEQSMVIFCVRNTSLSSKFDNNGQLYVMEILHNGDFLWSEILTLSDQGFPANILKISDTEYRVFWNDANSLSSVFSVTINNNSATLQTIRKPILYNYTYSTGFIVAGINYINSSDFYLLNLGSLEIENNLNKKVLVTKFDSEFSSAVKRGDIEYNQMMFGSYGGADLAFYQEYVNYLNMYQLSESQGLVCAPYQNGICLTYLFDGTPIYYDENMFISALEILTPNSVAAIVNNPDAPGESAMLIPALKLNSTIQSFAQVGVYATELENIDVQEKTMVKKITINNETYLLTGGTGLSGNVSLNLFDINGKSLKTHTFGAFYSYKLDKIIELNDAAIVLIGTTEVAYEVKRVFMIRIAKNVLLQ